MITLLAFVCYFPSLSSGFIWDDDMYITGSPFVKAADGLYGLWCTTQTPDYWPLSNSSFWIEWRLWGIHAGGYHALNLLFHIAVCGLIWCILRRLSIPGAFWAAMIFAVHPVNVESVAWIAQRKNVMALLFFLLSILWYLKAEMYMTIDDSWPTRSRGGLRERATSPWFGWYWLSFAAFILAMLSKGSVAVLPVLLLGIIWWRRRITLRDLARTAPFFTVAAILTLINIWFQRHDTSVIIRDAGFLERLLAAGGLICFYLYKAFLPLNLALVYPQWTVQTGDLLWWLPLGAVLIVTALLWLYRQGWSRPLLLAWGFFCTALLPCLGFTDVGFMMYSLASDHYQHIAIIGVITLTAAGWSCWRMWASGNVRRTADVMAVVAVCALALLTYRQCDLYRNPIMLYRGSLEKNPNCWVMLYNLGATLFNANQPAESIGYYLKAIKIQPNNFDEQVNIAEAYEKTGQLSPALEHYREALRMRPKTAKTHNNLGVVLLKLKRPQEAIEHFKEAIQVNPDFIEPYYNWALICADANQSAQAVLLAEKALSIARSKGQADKARQIERLLDLCRAGLSRQPGTSPADGPRTTSP